MRVETPNDIEFIDFIYAIASDPNQSEVVRSWAQRVYNQASFDLTRLCGRSTDYRAPFPEAEPPASWDI